MKIVTVVGARPQFIKAAALSREFAKHQNIKEIIIHTGQHYDINMSDIFFEEMKIPNPDYFLNINGLGHGAMTGQMLEKIEEVLIKEKPDWVLVYGDTNSTLAGALAAKKLMIKIAHVEAGLRSFNISMPEEVNRILTDRMSDLLLCPTNTAIENLQKEGYEDLDCSIVNTGDIMEDAAQFYHQFCTKPDIDLPKEFILATVHRAENTNDPNRLKSIFEALDEIAQDIPVILPLHPRTKNKIAKSRVLINHVQLIEPVGYLSMIWLLDHCKLVMTDSGGLQKEAFFFNNPCITLRDETEWVELVEHGFNKIVGADKAAILNAFKETINVDLDYSMNLYGKGKAAAKIVARILNYSIQNKEEQVLS